MKFIRSKTVGFVELSKEDVAHIVGRHIEATHPEAKRKGRVVVSNALDFSSGVVRIEKKEQP